ncbi:uroporphyrinogen-III synthase [Microbacterium sp. CH12i]|uniref:uroporphyrinogen-III synthase n=1 Tax=Microbacterium sp. CH12i TaxID=1479651 RepID=UPI000460D1DB|nr:uroporphyrinogen-III synthase [Microbacterium sp. CH12i]KDA05642.1 uroporphyrinogen-III synthase [Microbacterium sp. CH12i]
MTSRTLLDAALLGCTFVVAADRRAGDLSNALERRGAQVYRAPALSIVPNADDDDLIRRTRELIATPPHIVVVTTGVGFRGWVDAAHENDLAEELSEALRATLFVARGPKAHGAIQQAGFVADWVAESETAAEVGEYLRSMPLSAKRVAVQHHGAGSDGLDEVLLAAGADVVSLTVYRWGPPPDPQIVERSVAQAASGEVDGVLFTSAPGAAAWIRFAERMGATEAIRERAARGRLLLAAVGPITASPLHDARLSTVIAERGRLGSLARCVIGYFGVDGGAPSLKTAAGALSMRSGGVLLDGSFTPLSRAGASLLGALFDARGAVLSRDEIGRQLPGAGQNAHAVEMAVTRVRDALDGVDVVRTVVKRGYRLAVEETA